MRRLESDLASVGKMIESARRYVRSTGQAGDATHLEELLRRVSSKVRAICVSRGLQTADADNISQDTVLRVYRGLARFVPMAESKESNDPAAVEQELVVSDLAWLMSFERWTNTILANCLADFHQQPSRQEVQISPHAEAIADEDRPASNWAKLNPELRAQLISIPPDQLRASAESSERSDASQFDLRDWPGGMASLRPWLIGVALERLTVHHKTSQDDLDFLNQTVVKGTSSAEAAADGMGCQASKDQQRRAQARIRKRKSRLINKLRLEYELLASYLGLAVPKNGVADLGEN